MTTPVLPDGPLEREPLPAEYVNQSGRVELLQQTLAGVELGTYDERILLWLSSCDYGTVATIASWLRRAKATAS